MTDDADHPASLEEPAQSDPATVTSMPEPDIIDAEIVELMDTEGGGNVGTDEAEQVITEH